jgi:hypothetical protein
MQPELIIDERIIYGEDAIYRPCVLTLGDEKLTLDMDELIYSPWYMSNAY